MKVSSVFIITIIVATAVNYVASIPLNHSINHLANHRIITSNMKTSANVPEKSTAKANNNVYGADNAGTTGGQQQNNNNPQMINRGYNQGYSYNTGIKPYQSGYTYFQPFGDAVNQNGGGDNNTNNVPQQLPIQLPNFFGIDPKQMGPVRVIHNKNLPLDENGIPILDAIHIPENTNDANNGNNNQAPAPASPPPPPPVDVPVSPNDFTGDFNFNNILSGTNNANNANNNGGGNIFDFSPPSSNNFNFGRGNNGGDESDYNRLDDFAGNLNNFDTYLGDPSLMLDNTMPIASSSGNNANNNNQNGLAGFGFDGQQVPSEIVNLNNAFGTGSSNRNTNNLNDILNQFGGSGTNNNNNNNDMGDFGNFGSSSNGNPLFPFL